MGPHQRPDDSGSRFAVARWSNAIVTGTFMVAFLVPSLIGCMFVFGKEPSRDAPGLRSIGITVVPPLAAVLGLAAGGWVWGYLGT